MELSSELLDWILEYLVLIILGIIAIGFIIVGIKMSRKKYDGSDDDEEIEFMDVWDDDWFQDE